MAGSAALTFAENSDLEGKTNQCTAGEWENLKWLGSSYCLMPENSKDSLKAVAAWNLCVVGTWKPPYFLHSYFSDDSAAPHASSAFAAVAAASYTAVVAVKTSAAAFEM